MAHAIQIITADEQESNPSNAPSPGPPDFVDTLLEERLQQNVMGNHNEKLPEQASEMASVERVDGGTPHIRGHRCFDDADDKGGGACDSWTDERTKGSVPSDV